MYISLVLMMEVWAREREKTMFNETKITTLNLSFPLLFRKKKVFYVTAIYNIPLTWDEPTSMRLSSMLWFVILDLPYFCLRCVTKSSPGHKIINQNVKFHWNSREIYVRVLLGFFLLYKSIFVMSWSQFSFKISL